MGNNDPPASVRVRCDNGNERRWRSIQRASELYGVNNSDAIDYACNDVGELVSAIATVLERDDLTLEQRREIAATFDDATRGLEVDVAASSEVSADR